MSKTPQPYCRWCLEPNPEEAKFCHNCGKKLGTRDQTKWDGLKLLIHQNADPRMVEKLLLRYMGTLPEGYSSITLDEVIKAFGYLTEKQQQVLIRRADLDLRGTRSHKQIASEMGVRVKSARQRVAWATVCLWHALTYIDDKEEGQYVPSLAKIMDWANGMIPDP